MKKIRLIFLNLLALFIVSACTIKQTINFNEDMSGNNEVLIDYIGFMEEMEEMESLMGGSSSMDKDMGLEDLTVVFKDVEGITNLKNIQNTKDGLFGFSFDFKDTKILDEAMTSFLGEEGSSKEKAAKSYVQKKKKLILNFDNQDLGHMKESLVAQSMMIASMDYSLTVNFPFKVTSVDNKNYSLSADRKSMTATISLEDYLNGNKSLSTKVKW